jgi:cell division septation protein DedD
MDMESGKVKERIELSLDGRQIASIVVGALVLLGVVFVLGLNLGRQLAARQIEAGRGDVLAGLDRPPPAPAAPISDDALTFHDRLTKDRPPLADDPPARPAPSAATAAKPAPAAPAVAATAPKPPAPATTAAPSAAATAIKGLTAGAPPAAGAFSVQLVSTPSRAEADKLAAKLPEFEPRVEAAEVTGKGRVYRVRAGSFETRAEAEKAVKAIAAKVGTKGMVVSTRPK